HFRGYATTAVQHAFVGRVGLERYGVIDRKGAGAGVTVPAEQVCSGGSSYSCSNRDCAFDLANAFQRAKIDLHRTRACSSVNCILNRERAFINRSASRIGARKIEG